MKYSLWAPQIADIGITSNHPTPSKQSVYPDRRRPVNAPKKEYFMRVVLFTSLFLWTFHMR